MVFFPIPFFGWVFSAVLVFLLSIAAVEDLRRTIVPKWLTLSTLALGLVASLARGAWNGAAEIQTWWLSPTGLAPGMLDGFLFALAGVLVGFGVTFGLWILGICGGGDVKLNAALGAWVGPVNVLLVMLLAAVVLVLIVFVRLLPRFLQGKIRTGRRPKVRLVTFSLPVALGTTIVLAVTLLNDHLLREAQETSKQTVRNEVR